MTAAMDKFDLITLLRQCADDDVPVDRSVEQEAMTLAADAIDKMFGALAPFAWYYDVNDCRRHIRGGVLEVPISDLLKAKRALGKITLRTKTLTPR